MCLVINVCCTLGSAVAYVSAFKVERLGSLNPKPLRTRGLAVQGWVMGGGGLGLTLQDFAVLLRVLSLGFQKLHEPV